MRLTARLALFIALCIALSWYSWLLGYATAPGNSGINPLGAFATAILVALAGGWTNLKDYLRRIIRVRSHWTTYAAAVLVPLSLGIIAVALLVATGAPYPVAQAATGWKGSIDAFLFILLFVALGEEPAWRGWLLPSFRERLSPLGAALAVAPVWAVWHLPMWGRQLPYDQLVPFLVSLTAGSIFLAWLTNRTRGGVLPAMLCHAAVNAVSGGYLFTFAATDEKTLLWWIYAILWAIAATVVVLLTRGRLDDGVALPDTPANPATATVATS